MSKELTHEGALELLPWLVNDSLGEAERAPLERHVRGCLVCRAELRSQRELAALVRTQPAIDWSVEHGFDALLARIDESTRPSRAAYRWRWPLPGWQAALVGAAAAAVAVLALGLWLSLDGGERGSGGTYSVLTEQSSDTAGLIDVVFASGVDEAQIRGLLQEMGIAIVAGPTALGRYTIRAVPGAGTARDTAAFIERLRADPRVRFAGPSFMTEAAEGSQ